MKKILYTLLYSLICVGAMAQRSDAVFQFLKLPVSAHSAALGGENISIIEDDISLVSSNPALLSSVSDRSVGVSYMTYLAGSKCAGASYCQEHGERGSWAVSARYLDYGDFRETNEYDETLGTFRCKDMAFGFTYSYFFFDELVGGATGNIIYSNYDKNSAMAVGVDLGINYYNEDGGLSASFAIKNIGGQIVAFEDTREKLPVNVQLGISRTMPHAPFRLSATLTNLNHWSSSYFCPLGNKKLNFGQKFIRHLVLGADILLSDQFYVAAGYNFARGKELKEEGGSNWTGATIGAGLQLTKVKVGISYANYHVGASSVTFNFGLQL